MEMRGTPVRWPAPSPLPLLHVGLETGTRDGVKRWRAVRNKRRDHSSSDNRALLGNDYMDLLAHLTQ